MRTIHLRTLHIVATLVAWLAVSIPHSPGQELTLCPPNTTWLNSHLDCMFDIENKSSVPLLIKNIGLSGGGTIEIFRTTTSATFMGVESIPSEWTQIGSTFGRSGPSGIICSISSICTPELGLRLAPGEKLGLYVRTVSFPPFSQFVTRLSTNGHGIWLEDNYLAVHRGIISGPQFGISTPGIWEIPMGVIYTLGDADLVASYSTQAPEGLSVSLSGFAAGATLGYTLVSTATQLPMGTGPVLGLLPDATTFELLTTPYYPGNPLHFHPADPGVFPNAPWFASQQELIGLSGVSLDLVSVFLDSSGTLVDQSMVQRVMIP